MRNPLPQKLRERIFFAAEEPYFVRVGSLNFRRGYVTISAEYLSANGREPEITGGFFYEKHLIRLPRQ